MLRTRIVEENTLIQESFDEQINKVIEEIEEENIFNKIKDIKVINEQKVMIVYFEVIY